MRRIILIVATVVAALSVSAVALASSGKATPFKASYVYNVNWVCSGSHVVNSGTTALGQDSETCLLSGDEGLYPLGTTVYGPGVWSSDYFNNLGQYVVDQTFTVTKTANVDANNVPTGTYTLRIVAAF